MKIDIEMVKKIISAEENIMDENCIEYDEIMPLLKRYGKKENPENLFIRFLALGEGVEEHPEFLTALEELTTNNDSELIDYLIACNPQTPEKSRAILATKDDLSNESAIKLAENTKSVHILEYLYNTNRADLKTAILNNPTFDESKNYFECFQYCIENFSDYDINCIEKSRVPEELKELYDYYVKVRYYDVLISQAACNAETAYQMDNEEEVEEYDYQLGEFQKELSELLNNKPIVKRINK